MVNSTGVEHHRHKRKRVHKKLEKYPHPKKWKRFLDRVVFFAALFGPIITIPQILSIYLYQNASGVSQITWIGYLLSSLIWFTYGVAHKDKPLIFSGVMWIAIEIVILVGIRIY